MLALLQQVGGSGIVNWSTLNTMLLLGAILYLYRQARTVDAVRQVMLGAGGEDTGAIGELKALGVTTTGLSTAITKLNGTVAGLNDRLDKIEEREVRDAVLRVERRNFERGQ